MNHRLKRLLVLVVGALSAVAGLQATTVAPAHAGQLGLTIEIKGAAKVTVIEGSVADGAATECDFRHSLDDRVVNTCPRIRSEAVFSATLWLRIEVAQSDTDEWRPSNWSGCDSVRQVRGDQYDCKVVSDAFGTSEKTVRAVAYDATTPEMTSWSSRRSTTQDLTAVYSFTATQGTFECSADRAVTFFPCESGFSYTWPVPGTHRMVVRAVDVSGNRPGVVGMEERLLDTYLRSGPPAEAGSRSARFVMDSPGADALQCSLDGAAFAFCGTPGVPFELTGLRNGTHELRVYGADATSRDELPAVHRWTVGVFPDTHLDSVALVDRTAQFRFSSATGTSYSCRLLGPEEFHFDWLACQSPVTLEDLPDAGYTFEVRARDSDGEVDPSPASHAFRIDGPVDPGPVDPGPVDPGPVDPGPIDPGPVTPAPLPRTATVVKVVDADTLVLRAGARTFRADLAGLAPVTTPRCVVRRGRVVLARAARPGRDRAARRGPRFAGHRHEPVDGAGRSARPRARPAGAGPGPLRPPRGAVGCPLDVREGAAAGEAREARCVGPLLTPRTNGDVIRAGAPGHRLG
jgi:hypothetical protein